MWYYASVPVTFVTVPAIVRGYGGVMRLATGSKLDDGLFEVVLFPRAGILSLAGDALRGLIGRLPGGSCKNSDGSPAAIWRESGRRWSWSEASSE